MKHTSQPFVIVVWDDAHGSATTDVTIEDLDHKPIVMTTVGWLLRQDERGISVANERCEEGGKTVYRGHTFIPRAMVRSATPMVLVRPRKKRSSPQPPSPEDQPA
jgi:hypothetical protein